MAIVLNFAMAHQTGKLQGTQCTKQALVSIEVVPEVKKGLGPTRYMHWLWVLPNRRLQTPVFVPSSDVDE